MGSCDTAIVVITYLLWLTLLDCSIFVSAKFFFRDNINEYSGPQNNVNYLACTQFPEKENRCGSKKVANYIFSVADEFH